MDLEGRLRESIFIVHDFCNFVACLCVIFQSGAVDPGGGNSGDCGGRGGREEDAPNFSNDYLFSK